MAHETAPRVPDDAPNKLRLHACQRLLRWSIEYAQSWSGLNRQSSADLLIFSMHARSTRTYEAIVRQLGRSGMGEQGMMLNRSLFEDMVDIHWVQLNPDLAMERLELHDRYSRFLRTRVARAYPEMHDEVPARLELCDEDRQKMPKLFGDYGEKSWTGAGSLDKRLKAVLSCWPSEADRRQVKWWHEWVHKLFNETLHPSAWSLGRMMPPVPLREGESLEWRFGSTPEWLAQSLHGSMWTYAQIVGLVLDHFQLDAQQLGDLFAQAHKDFRRANHWERTGRLDAPPDELAGNGGNEVAPVD
jgi:hypothetical protein